MVDVIIGLGSGRKSIFPCLFQLHSCVRVRALSENLGVQGIDQGACHKRKQTDIYADPTPYVVEIHGCRRLEYCRPETIQVNNQLMLYV